MRTFIVALVLALALLAGFAAQAVKVPTSIVDLNQATRADLMQLPGVGPGRADAILKYRSAQPFRRAADLLRIKGFGRRTFVRLRPFVTVGPVPGASASGSALPGAVAGATAASPGNSASLPQVSAAGVAGAGAGAGAGQEVAQDAPRGPAAPGREVAAKP